MSVEAMPHHLFTVGELKLEANSCCSPFVVVPVVVRVGIELPVVPVDEIQSS